MSIVVDFAKPAKTVKRSRTASESSAEVRVKRTEDFLSSPLLLPLSAVFRSRSGSNP